MKFGGKLYGTGRMWGGILGVAYAFDPASSVQTAIHAFTGGADGADPDSPLIDVGGSLYGTTLEGGICARDANGCGALFSLDPATGAESVVYAFEGGSDGEAP